MHTIRLTGAWELEPGDPVRLLRPFHWVAPRVADERIELVIGVVQCDVAICLNDTRLGKVSPADVPVRFDVTELLKPSNRLVVVFSGQDLSIDNAVEHVRLEISDRDQQNGERDA